MRALSSQMVAYVCKTKNIIYRTATQKSIGIGQKVLYINGKKHTTQDKKNGTKYIVNQNTKLLPKLIRYRIMWMPHKKNTSIYHILHPQPCVQHVPCFACQSLTVNFFKAVILLILLPKKVLIINNIISSHYM